MPQAKRKDKTVALVKKIIAKPVRKVTKPKKVKPGK